MSRLIILLCAALFNSVSSVFSDCKYFEEKKKVGINEFSRASQELYASSEKFHHDFYLELENIRAELESNATTLYQNGTLFANIHHCVDLHEELEEDINIAIRRGCLCNVRKVQDADLIIDDYFDEFSITFDTIIKDAYSQQVQQSVENVNNNIISVRDKIDELLAETTNYLTSIIIHFEKSMVMCSPCITVGDIVARAMYVLREIQVCIDGSIHFHR